MVLTLMDALTMPRYVEQVLDRDELPNPSLFTVCWRTIPSPPVSQSKAKAAPEKFGKRPFVWGHWRNFSIGECELEQTRDI